MKIPEEFIGCRVKSDNKNFHNYGQILGRIVSGFSREDSAYFLIITDSGTFRTIDVDYAKIHKEDMSKIRTCLVFEKSDRFEIMDL